MPQLPRLTKQDAKVIILKCLIASTEKLFDARFDESDLADDISKEDLKILREARDLQVKRLQENLTYAKKN